MLWASILAHSLIWTFGKMLSINLLGPELQYLASTSERFWVFYPWPYISQAHHPPIYFSISSPWPLITPQYSYWKKFNYSFSEKISFYYATKSWKMHLCLISNYKIPSSSQNPRIRYYPKILHIISASFPSLLISIQSPARIYLYLDLFLLKFLFISKSSEWVLTFRFSPMTLCLHSLNIKEYISLISQVLVQPELLQYLRTSNLMYFSLG